MRLQRFDLLVERAADVEPDVRLSGAEEQHARHAVLLQLPLELLGEEEMIARGDHAVETAPAGGAMVGVDLVVAPGVVREDGVGLVLADRAADLAAKAHRHLELTVLLPEKYELLHADGLARGALLALADLRDLAS